ncbi:MULTISPECIES: LacI family DNA-binding transcriptional regulator [unclassified Streptomyces]|uniref:LacI family DNA-binding transcriptional regulator n=1 Tax=unclassified Streptomyces TaxID=2593676 RepID=UPI003D8AE38E
MSSRATISDVARLAGVHKATASRALNPATSGRVKAATARRVQQAAKQLGYTPNAVARSLRTNRSFTVGVLLPDLTNPLFPPIVRGIEEVLSVQGYTALLSNTDNDDDRERAQFQALIDRQVDGFIIATGQRRHPLLEGAFEAGVPVVLVNRGTDQSMFPLVSGDDGTGVALAVDHLVELGHRAIAHLAGPPGLTTSLVRTRAFRQASQAHALPADLTPVVASAAYEEKAGARAAEELLDAHPEVTAIVAGNDLIALGALHTLRARGLSCPQDVSVIGFNDMRFVDEFQPPLTSVRVPHQELGAEAARLLLEQLQSDPEQPRSRRPIPKTVMLPVRLVVRGSTASPRTQTS